MKFTKRRAEFEARWEPEACYPDTGGGLFLVCKGSRREIELAAPGDKRACQIGSKLSKALGPKKKTVKIVVTY